MSESSAEEVVGFARFRYPNKGYQGVLPMRLSCIRSQALEIWTARKAELILFVLGLVCLTVHPCVAQSSHLQCTRENPLVFYAKFFSDSTFQRNRLAEVILEEVPSDTNDEFSPMVTKEIRREDWHFDGGLAEMNTLGEKNLLDTWEGQRRRGMSLDQFKSVFLSTGGLTLWDVRETGDTLRILFGAPETEFAATYTFVYRADSLILLRRN